MEVRFSKRGQQENGAFLLISTANQAPECLLDTPCLSLFCISSFQAEKSGAQLEGVLRSHMIMRDGHRRDSVIYSWLDTEWTALRIALCAKFGWSLPVAGGASTRANVVE